MSAVQHNDGFTIAGGFEPATPWQTSLTPPNSNSEKWSLSQSPAEVGDGTASALRNSLVAVNLYHHRSSSLRVPFLPGEDDGEQTEAVMLNNKSSMGAASTTHHFHFDEVRHQHDTSVASLLDELMEEAATEDVSNRSFFVQSSLQMQYPNDKAVACGNLLTLTEIVAPTSSSSGAGTAVFGNAIATASTSIDVAEPTAQRAE